TRSHPGRGRSGKGIEAAVFKFAGHARSPRRKIVAGVEDVSGQGKWDVLVAGQQGVTAKFVASLAAELDSVVVVAQSNAAVVIRSFELNGTAFGVQKRRFTGLDAEDLRVGARRQKQ